MAPGALTTERPGVALPDIIEALAEHWDEVAPHLAPGDVALIARALHRMTAVPSADSTAAADIVQILAERLPAGHVVAELISAETRLAHPGATSGVPPSDALRFLLAVPALRAAGAGGQQDDHAASGAGEQAGIPARAQPDDPAADAWLLDAPALTEQQVRDRGGDPRRNDLIRLTTPAGQVVLPTFQFGRSGQPVPVVARINRLLAAAEDPWGVADWWLGANAWLDAVPAGLIGRVDDGLLLRAALAELPGE